MVKSFKLNSDKRPCFSGIIIIISGVVESTTSMNNQYLLVIIVIFVGNKSEGNPIVMKTFNLLSNALQPNSEPRVGTGVYLRDSFRKQVLIPTFNRVKENIKEVIETNNSQTLFIGIFCGVTCVILLFMTLAIISLRRKIKVMGERK